MKTIKIILSALAFCILLPSCEMDEYYLSGTVFIEDPYYPGLPEDSEWGYNTFGAYIDREPFVSTENGLPSKIIVNADTIHMILKGKMAGKEVGLTFSFKGFSPESNYDLTELNGTVIDLGESGRAVSLKIGNEIHTLDIIEGELNIRKVQRLYVDEELSRTIMSGYFQLKTFLSNEPIAISQGRFDLGIGYENFYNF